MTCRNCGVEIAEKALICYRCGTAATEPRITPPPSESLLGPPRRSRSWLLVVGAVLVAALIAAAVLISGF